MRSEGGECRMCVGGDLCGYGVGLVHVLVGIVRPRSRERLKREIELCGY